MRTKNLLYPFKVGNKEGFTLIELMIVIAVVSIMAAIAIPAYTSNVEKTRRADAQGSFLQFANAMERHYTEQTPFTYVGATVGSATSNTFTNQSPKTGTAFYTLSISAVGTNSYTLQATPTGSQSSDTCGSLTLTNAGVKGVSSSTVDLCW